MKTDIAKGDFVEVLVDAGGGSSGEYTVEATIAGRTVEVRSSRTTVEVRELTRTGGVVRTARFIALRVLAVVEHPSRDKGRDRPRSAARPHAALPDLDSPPGMEELLASWEGESVSVHRDWATGTWMFICCHSSRLGPFGGGTRMKHYPSLTEALVDGLRLSEAMTLKLASVGFPRGGGKAVIALPTPELPQGEARRRLLREFGAFVRSLGGMFSCAPDMNTSSEDMDVIAEVCPFVFGKTQTAGGSGDTAPDTAVGVFHGMRASCRFVFGSDDLAGRKVVVQGAGGVGGRLIELLREAGAEVIAADIDGPRLDSLKRSGVKVVATGDVLTTECDVLAPCATGGILNARTIPGLRCRLVAGAANNQLETPSDADLLFERGIVYAPDFVINAGGVLHAGGLEELGWTREILATRLAGIGDTVFAILQRAKEEGISTDAAARRIAQLRLDAVTP